MTATSARPRPIASFLFAKSGALFTLLVLMLLAVQSHAGQATVAWNASTSAGVAGYMLHYGQVSGSYSSKMDAGNKTTITVPGLLEGKKYYFAATAYDAGRTESGFSNEASIVVPSTAPAANFSASKTSGAAPLAVTFTSTSAGTISAYAWTFGDGATSTAQNPSHTYSAKGTYSVSLKVTGPGGNNTQTKSGYITVLASGTTPPPVASFSASKTSGPAPLAVTFSSTSTGSISSYAWTFGDGATSTAQNPSHTYSKTGTYSVSLKVTGSGGSNTQTKSGYIVVSTGTTTSPPVAGFTSNTRSGTAPLAVNFSSTSTGSINSYAWTFGDGGTSTAQNPSHTYSKAGTYSVSLKVTGSAGSNTKTQSGYVTISTATSSPLFANFSVAKTSGSTAPLVLAFTNTSTGNISSYAWNFGDGGTSTLKNPTHSFAALGYHTITLKITGTDGKTNFVSKLIRY